MRIPTALIGLGCAVLLATSAPASHVAAATARTVPTKIQHYQFDPADFATDTTVTNEFYPLVPGMQWVREGATSVGHRRVPHQVITTVTDVGRTVDGVRAVALYDRDLDAGQVSQESLDYLAVDATGNVWYLGSYTEALEGGQFVSVRDAWLAGIKGGKPGVLMPAAPKRGDSWFIAGAPGDGSDVGAVVRFERKHCVPFRCFRDVLVVREGKASAPDNEHKVYAPGVGQIDNVPRSASQHRDIEKLVNLTQLTPEGLAEASAAALRLDEHARTTKADVFARDPAATRSP